MNLYRFHNQNGAILITALVFLVILTMLVLSSMGTNVMEERMAANHQESNRAFQAAESGLASAFADADSFSTSNTEDNPVTGNIPDFGGQGINVSYGTAFRQKTSPKRGSGWDSSYALYHFDISSTSISGSGASSKVHAGAYQLGKDN